MDRYELTEALRAIRDLLWQIRGLCEGVSETTIPATRAELLYALRSSASAAADAEHLLQEAS